MSESSRHGKDPDELLISSEKLPIHEAVTAFEIAVKNAIYSGRSDDAAELIESYLDYFEEPLPYDVRFFCEYQTATRYWRDGAIDKAEAQYRFCRDLAEEVSAERDVARCNMAIGVTKWSKGDTAAALSFMEKAEEVLRHQRDKSLSNCLNWLGIVCSNLRMISRAWKYYTEALELNEEMGYSPNQGFLLCNLGLLCLQMGLTEEAESNFRESMKLHEQCSNRYGYMDALANLGMLLLKDRDLPEEALPILLEAAEGQLENRDKAKAGLVYGQAASAAYASGDREQAVSLFRTAEDLVSEARVWTNCVDVFGRQAEFYLAEKDIEAAEEHVIRAIELHNTNMPDTADDELMVLHAHILAAKGEYEEAYLLLSSSEEAWKEMRTVKFTALQGVLRLIRESAGKSRELQEARHRAELLEERSRALAGSEERFKGLVNRMAGVGVLAVDRNAAVTFWNTTCETLYGYTFEEVSGRKITDFLVPEHLNQWFIRLLRHGSSDQSFEVNMVTADGGMKHILLSMVPGERDEIFLVQVDMTSQRMAENQRSLIEAQMRRTQKLEALGTLAGGIAHDFNNLLQGILANASMLCNSLESSTQNHENAELIHRAAERSSELCMQMLDYAGVKSVGHELIDLNHLVYDMAALLKTSFPVSVQLILQPGENIPMVMGDRSQLRQIIMNLALNGAEAVEREGSVVVSTRLQRMSSDDFADNLLEETPRSGDYLCLKVKDTGSGIDPRTLTRIFDPFFSTKKTGRGLGLAAVLGIVRAHGGAMMVSSTPEEGSEFMVYLQASESEAEAAKEKEAVPDFSLGGLNILIVDDEEIVRDTLTAVLSMEDAFPVAVDGGAEALEYLSRNHEKTQLVILDLTMPGMNGVDVFRSIEEQGCKVPVLMISGYSREKLESVFRTGGPAGFLQKPFSPSELRQKIAQILSRG